jgi:hypothetical protein
VPANEPRVPGRRLFVARSVGTKLCCALLLLAPLCLVNTPEAASQITVPSQASDDKLQASFRQLARQMSDLSDRLDRAASLSERASRIVGQPGASGAATGPAPATVERGTAAPGLTGENTMAALEQLVSRRRDVLALTQSLSAKLNGPPRAGDGSRVAERAPAAKADASLEALKALSADLATADFRPDVQAAQATLDASRKAAQDAARAAWGKASRATIDSVVPKRISTMVAPAAGARANFSATSVEDHLTLVFLLSTGDAREGLKTVLQSAAAANDRLYQAATKAQTAIDGTRIDLLLAVADTHLTTRSAGGPKGYDIASLVDYQISRAGLPKTDARDQQLKKLAEELDVLKQQKRGIIPQIADLKLEILQLNADCAAAASRVAAATAQAQKAAEAAGTGALIGGIFGGPAGAALGAAIAVAASGGVPSPEDLAKLDDCKRQAELEQRVVRLQGQLAEIETRIKGAIQAIEKIRSTPEVLKATAPAVAPGGLVRPRPSAKNPPVATANRPSGSSGSNTSRSNSAMDRLTGGGGGLSSAAGSSGPVGAPGRRPPSASGSVGSSGINTSRPIGSGSGGSSGVNMSRQP